MEGFPVLQDQRGDWTSPKTIRVAGVPILQFFTQNPRLLQEYIENFLTRPSDVFVCTYPKSGTTWLQEIVWQLYNDGVTSTRKIHERVPFVERLTDSSRADFRGLPSPRLMHTHLNHDVIPKGQSEDTKCKYIYVARNPKDVAVSYYNFMRDMAATTGYNGPWQFFAELFLEGKVPYGCWVDHVLGWWKHKDDPNVLFLKYEDMKKDLVSNVRVIAEFLDKPITDDVVTQIAEQCTFQEMKKNESSFTLDGLASHAKLLRKGEVGDWVNYFTPELDERFENEILSELEGTGLEFQFTLS